MKLTKAIILLVLSSSSAWATETISYVYDALGRVTQSSHSGGPQNGQQTTYTIDPAGNRKNTTTTGASP
jgi:YD repeat-containing protein